MVQMENIAHATQLRAMAPPWPSSHCLIRLPHGRVLPKQDLMWLWVPIILAAVTGSLLEAETRFPGVAELLPQVPFASEAAAAIHHRLMAGFPAGVDIPPRCAHSHESV